MQKLIRLLAVVSLTFAPLSYADFDFKGPGELRFQSGTSDGFYFGFGWEEATNQFRIGPKKYTMAEIPSSYSIAITLSKDESNVWIQEFYQGYIEEFSWQLGSNTLSLKKGDFVKSVKGNYVLNLNGIEYLFDRNNISIDVTFDNDNIKNIKLEGVIKNMGTK
jgi:hypothetical protein